MVSSNEENKLIINSNLNSSIGASNLNSPIGASFMTYNSIMN